MESSNYYDILNVDKRASHDEIKKAYRKLSLKYHPDRNPNSKDVFLKINEAYETLGDTDKKKRYDMMFSCAFFSSNSSPSPSTPINVEHIFSELFKNINMNNTEKNNNNNNNNSKQVFQLFTEMLPHAVKLAQTYTQDSSDERTVNQQHKGEFPTNYEKPTPILKNINITMQQVYHGASVPLLVERWIIINNIKTFETETMYISIPKGIDQNEMIVLREKGNIVNEYLKGDIKIFIQIENHSEFKRDGLDLILEKTISLKEALCGFTFDFLFLNGKRYMINTEGTLIYPEFKKKIPKMGLTRETENVGDLIVFFHIVFPSELSRETISSLKEIL